jgi:hypothetical protein
MKHARLMWIGLAVIVAAGTTAFALANGRAPRRATATAASTSTACSAEQAAQCTPEMAAQCGAKGANGSECRMGGASATTAAMDPSQCPYMKGAKAGEACDPSTCPPGMCEGMGKAKGVSATAASASGECSMHGAGAAAKAGKAGDACCAGGAKGAAATLAGGPACGAHGTAATTAAMSCDACADMAACQSDIAEAGGKVQTVSLKNGLMYIYSAESSPRVRAVQAAVRRHAERVAALSAAGDNAHLCGDCREMRGAMASGKLTREVVDVETGCLMLVTSNDPRVVSRLYAIAGVTGNPARPVAKS